MLNSDSSRTSTIQRKKAIYSKINFWSGIVAFLIAVAGLILNIVTEFVTVDFYIHLALAITICTMGLLAIISLFISWLKLRKLEKQLKVEDSESSENEVE